MRQGRSRETSLSPPRGSLVLLLQPTAYAVGLRSLCRFAAQTRSRHGRGQGGPLEMLGVENNGLNDYRVAVVWASGDNFL
jgi:hypothetical protein